MKVSPSSEFTSLAVTLRTKLVPSKCLSALPAERVGASFIVTDEPVTGAADCQLLEPEKLTTCSLLAHPTVLDNE